MTCRRCKSKRILRVSAKCSDMCVVKELDTGNEQQGYVPDHCGIMAGNDDYVDFDLCLTCGQLQGEFPQPGLQ